MAEPKPVTLITGASAGIGAALAQEFASHGHDLVLVARRTVQLDALAGAIETLGFARPRIIGADLTRADAPAQIAEELAAHALEPNFVVNNAGFGLHGPAAELDRTEQLAMIDLNARALTDLSLCFLDSLTRRRGGILNVASIASFMPGPGFAVYYATKAYVLSFSEALHHEFKPKGVRVTALCPGPVDTGFQVRAGVPVGYFPVNFNLGRSVERVSHDGYEGLMAGKRVVIPGFHSQLAAFLPRLAPRGLVLPLMDRLRRD